MIGDYPLQPSWLVERKKYWSGLTLHAGIHLLLLVVLTGRSVLLLWPYLLLLAGVHLLIDYFKNWLSRTRPDWVVGPYLFDQLLHLISILVVLGLVGSNGYGVDLPLPVSWTVLAAGYLFVTQIWFISERILRSSSLANIAKINRFKWSRMGTRVLFFTVFVWGFTALFGSVRLGGSLLIGLFPMYRSDRFGRESLIIDLLISAAAAGLVAAALTQGSAAAPAP